MLPDGVCSLCRANATNFERAYSYGTYEGSLAALVHLFKYKGIRTLSKPLGELMARGLPSSERFDAIVPVPLHWRKKLSRGFNQADLLAETIGRRTGIPVIHGLKRRRNTDTQAGLTNAMRRKNVDGAFVATSCAFQGKRVLLIDDVVTTGATVSAAAKALCRAGAARVTVLTLARVDRRMPAMLFKNPSQAEFAVTGAS